jgi:GNAT superfamily N-acetyltransferase/8-oxo-dGTP pyrophosphatase MutT (NUDIX family)
MPASNELQFPPDWVPLNPEIPRAAALHIYRRVQEGRISREELAEAAAWVSKRPMVPPGDWYHSFRTFKLVGRGSTPTSVLAKTMKPWGICVGSTLSRFLLPRTAAEQEIGGEDGAEGYWAGEDNTASGILPIAADTKRICLAWRNKECHQGDTWGTIGGACQEGLSPEESAKAEMAEEVGYDDQIELQPAWVFRDEESGFRYVNLVGIVPKEFTFAPSDEHAWETDFIEWRTLSEIREDMKANPGDYHPELINLFKHSANLIEKATGAQPDKTRTAGSSNSASVMIRTAMPDFGYSRYNDRDKELAALHWETASGGGAGGACRETWFRVTALLPEGHLPTPSDERGTLLPGVAEIECARYEPNWEPEAGVTPDDFAVRWVEIAPGWRGTGLGQMLYEKAAEKAKAMGAERLYSDESRSPEAMKAWQRLSQRYRVEGPISSWQRSAILLKAAATTPKLKWRIQRGAEHFRLTALDATEADSIVGAIRCVLDPGDGAAEYAVEDFWCDHNLRLAGIPTLLYERAVREARSLGAVSFYDDQAGSPDAIRAWEGLSERYPVRRTGMRFYVLLTEAPFSKASFYNPASKPETRYLEESNGWALFPDQREGAADPFPSESPVENYPTPA